MSDPEIHVYVAPSMHRFRPRRVPDGDWSEALPLAYDLAAAVRPDLLVAVGIVRGSAYFGYCQSIREHGLPTLSYAVGSWDRSAGDGDGDEAHAAFRDHNRRWYLGFSYPLRISLDEAATHFRDDAVDLIHVGRHLPADELAGELHRWHARLRPGGLLVAEDTGAPGSQVRSAWEELPADGRRFLFRRAAGPGVLRKPGGRPLERCAPLVRFLCDEDADDAEGMRTVYARIARHLELARRTDRSEYGRDHRG